MRSVGVFADLWQSIGACMRTSIVESRNKAKILSFRTRRQAGEEPALHNNAGEQPATNDYFGYQSSNLTSIPVPASAF